VAAVSAETEPEPANEERKREKKGEEEFGEADEAVLEKTGTDEQCRTERDDAGRRVDGDSVLPRLVALDGSLNEQHRAIADRDTVEQREGGGRQFLVGEEESQNESRGKLYRKAMLLLLRAGASVPIVTLCTHSMKNKKNQTQKPLAYAKR